MGGEVGDMEGQALLTEGGRRGGAGGGGGGCVCCASSSSSSSSSELSSVRSITSTFLPPLLPSLWLDEEEELCWSETEDVLQEPGEPQWFWHVTLIIVWTYNRVRCHVGRTSTTITWLTKIKQLINSKSMISPLCFYATKYKFFFRYLLFFFILNEI